VTSVDKAVNGVHHVTYKVTTTNGGEITVVYSQGSSPSVPSPWSVDTTVTGSVASVSASVGVDVTDGLTCEIIDKDTGRSVVRNSVPPSPGAAITCSTISLGG
jgi:hypothetical protein